MQFTAVFSQTTSSICITKHLLYTPFLNVDCKWRIQLYHYKWSIRMTIFLVWYGVLFGPTEIRIIFFTGCLDQNHSVNKHCKIAGMISGWGGVLLCQFDYQTKCVPRKLLVTTIYKVLEKKTVHIFLGILLWSLQEMNGFTHWLLNKFSNYICNIFPWQSFYILFQFSMTLIPKGMRSQHWFRPWWQSWTNYDPGYWGMYE